MILPYQNVEKCPCNVIPIIGGAGITGFVWNVVVSHIIFGNRQRCDFVGLKL
jgi:hypothetical protein